MPPETPDRPTATTDRLLAVIAPRRQRDPNRPVVEDSEWLPMMWRMLRALEARAIERPENLPQILALVQRMNEIPNVVIAANAERYEIDPMKGASLKECARYMGISYQAVSQRRKLGKAVTLARIAAAGAIPFSEAKREREAIKAAEKFAEEIREEYRPRHLKVV